MQKLWLLVSIHEFYPKDIPMTARAIPARLPPILREEPRQELKNSIRVQCYKFNSLAELEEVANESLKKDSTNQYMIFEAISVMEIIPTNPICKKFNENGELLI